MTETKADERYCSQHRQPRSECRPDDRHVQPLRCADELFAQVEAMGKTLGLDRNAAAEQAFREFVERHGKAPSGARVRSPGGGREKRSTARTEPPAPVPVAAGPDLAATVAQLRREMDKLMAGNDEPMARARKRAAVTAPGTVLFREPGAEPVSSFPGPGSTGPGQERAGGVMSGHTCPAGSCFAIGTWEDAFIHCDLPAGHKTLCEHVDEERSLRWLQDNYGNISAIPGTRGDHERWLASMNASFQGGA